MKNWHLSHSYQTLPEDFYVSVMPEKVNNPQIVVVNRALLQSLGFSIDEYNKSELAQYFSGACLPVSAVPIAQAYAGHQFGYLNNLGDGRAILLGELQTPEGSFFDIQLKGSGKTPFSRQGDGKATLSSMLREYLMSEAMAALGIPTTRSLAVTTTGEWIQRIDKQEAAVLVRVAQSHLRVGTFVYADILARQQNNPDLLKALLDYSIHRHYPELYHAENPALALLETVINKQIVLTNHWLRVGFIHGVLNTDNVSISGETIDYGPCAFMDTYHQNTVYSSIDKNGRYAFGEQVPITRWNLARFAESLLPLISDDRLQSIDMVSEKLEAFYPKQKAAWFAMMRSKLGIIDDDHDDSSLIDDLLIIMQEKQLDYTNTFVALTKFIMGVDDNLPEGKKFTAWKQRWLERVKKNDTKSIVQMQENNPVIIPRNHRVEQALTEAEKGDMAAFSHLLTVLVNPYQWDDFSQYTDYQTPASRVWQSTYQTFCGT